AGWAVGWWVMKTGRLNLVGVSFFGKPEKPLPVCGGGWGRWDKKKLPPSKKLWVGLKYTTQNYFKKRI
ncbi:hypothetical protein, partial [Escherichia coli]|uniref:hypothetical protein n=1 Tax=Escherichia coli TaxID=562 RepID=UPI0021C6751B